MVIWSIPFHPIASDGILNSSVFKVSGPGRGAYPRDINPATSPNVLLLTTCQNKGIDRNVCLSVGPSARPSICMHGHTYVRIIHDAAWCSRIFFDVLYFILRRASSVLMLSLWGALWRSSPGGCLPGDWGNKTRVGKAPPNKGLVNIYVMYIMNVHTILDHDPLCGGFKND